MSKHPVVARRSQLAKRAEEPSRFPLPAEPTSSAFGFRYSSIEISASDAGARIKRREARFENGTFKSESFDGTIDRGTYESYVRDARESMLRQTAAMMRALFWFLPSAQRDDRKD